MAVAIMVSVCGQQRDRAAADSLDICIYASGCDKVDLECLAR